MEEYSLQWDSFRENFVSGFSSVYTLGDYCDVDLACDDGKVLQAHKIILGICSPYFRTMLARNPCKHPTFILKDINNTTMSSILEFMYKGEVNVKQHEFKTFMKVAKMFKIKGLIDTDDENIIDVPVIPAPTKYASPPKLAKVQTPRPRPTTTVSTSSAIKTNKRRPESSLVESSSSKQIKYEEVPDASDPLIQESVYGDDVLEDEPEDEEVLEQKFTIEVQPAEEIEHLDPIDQHLEQYDQRDAASSELVEHGDDDDDEDDEFDDQGLSLLRESESLRPVKRDTPKTSTTVAKPRVAPTTSYTSSTLNLHTAVKNLGLPPMPFSSYKDFITFENKVREDEELMAALKKSYMSISTDSYNPYITCNMRQLLQGTSTRRFVWKNASKNFIAIGRFLVMKVLRECAMHKFPKIHSKQINHTMAMWLKNQKNFERKRMIRENKLAEMEAIDEADIKDLQNFDFVKLETDDFRIVVNSDNDDKISSYEYVTEMVGDFVDEEEV